MRFLKQLILLVALMSLIITAIVAYNRIKATEGLNNNINIANDLTSTFRNERTLMQNMSDYLIQIDTCSEFFVIELSNGAFYFRNDFLKPGERLPLEDFFRVCAQENPHATCCNANENKNFTAQIKSYMNHHQLNRVVIRNTGDNISIRYKYPNRLYHPADRRLTLNYSVQNYDGHQASDKNPSNDYNWKISLSPNWWIESEKESYR